MVSLYISITDVTGIVVGILFGGAIIIGLVVCCIYIKNRRFGNAGHAQRGAALAVSEERTALTTQPAATPQYPLQQVGPPPAGSYPPQSGGSYPPPPAGSYPQQPQMMYPPGSSYPQHPQGNYPPQPGGSYPQQPQAGYPTSTSGYPPADVPETPPPAYPGPPVYPTQSNQPYNPQFQGTQPNPPYPPPKGSENQAAAPYPVTLETHSAPAKV